VINHERGKDREVEVSIMIFFRRVIPTKYKFLATSSIVSYPRVFIVPAIILSVFMFLFIFVMICGIFEWKQVFINIVCIYVCILEIQ